MTAEGGVASLEAGPTRETAGRTQKPWACTGPEEAQEGFPGPSVDTARGTGQSRGGTVPTGVSRQVAQRALARGPGVATCHQQGCLWIPHSVPEPSNLRRVIL